MAGSSTIGGKQARAFLSYARADGQEFARQIRTRLEEANIPLWQDRESMEGGRDWWFQIVEALDHVEFMVLIMTPAALQSKTVRKEWRYARQKGVCVYPVKGPLSIDFANLSRWMRDVHWYDLNYEWLKFVNDLNTHCEQPSVPFMVEDLPEDFVKRPQEFDALLNLLLDQNREEPIAITAALRGAGGYGKTTIARAICHDERIQEAFDDGILWVTLGEHPASMIGVVEDLIYILSHERPGFTGIDAAVARLAELLEERDILLVIDDAWNGAHLKPFLHGGKRCARLITTRDEGVLPRTAQRILVDAMQQEQAVQLLSAGLDASPRSEVETQALHQLATRLGEWPLLLTLVNGALRERMNRGQQLADALFSTNRTLDRRGLTAFDAKNAQERHQAVAKTLEVSFDLLSSNDHMRFRELAIFPKDVDIPIATVQRLWGATGGLDDLDTEDVCEHLYSFSLLLRFDLAMRTIRLHDVMCAYLQQNIGATELRALHAQFLHSYSCSRWSELPPDEPYLWDHLTEHLIGAQHTEELVATVKDARYLIAKTHLCSVYAVETDVSRALQQAPGDKVLPLLKRGIAQMSHMLNRCKTKREVAGILHSGLAPFRELADICSGLEQDFPRPFLTSWYALPYLKHAMLLRTLSGHTGYVNGCAVSPSADFIVSASYDSTLKVWDALTGAQRLTLRGHTGYVNGCAVSPSGNFIVSASYDSTLKVWDARTGAEQFTLLGHTAAVTGCTISPTGDFIVSASADQTLKVWDVHTGVVQRTLRGHTAAVTGCAVSPTGHFIVSASADRTLIVWDAVTGVERLTLRGHTGYVYGCAISPSEDFIVSASEDRTLKVWDTHTGAQRLTLHGHIDYVYGCVVSPTGDFIVSASGDRTLKVWDAQLGAEQYSLRGHTDYVYGCVVSPSEDFIVSASGDRTLKVWDAHTGSERLTLCGHTDYVYDCAVSLGGEFIISASYDKTLKIWDAQTGIEQLTLRGHTGYVNSCAISPSGDFIVSASSDKTLKVWNTHTGAEQLTLLGHSADVNGCSVSPTGGFIVSASADQTLKLWDPHTGSERFTLRGHSAAVTGCAISPTGDFIVSASVDHTLKVWDTRTGVERLTLIGHSSAVSGCAVSPTGNFIISASADQTLKVWDAHTGVCLDTFLAEGFLAECAFCPDGGHIVAVGEQGVYFLRLLV